MTVLWSWADLGNHSLQLYTIKQYWLLMSVLSVKKFNPEWKRVIVLDNITADFLKEKSWDELWDEVKVVDFSNTEFGDLNNIHIYSWPKLYSYGLIDDDVLVLDVDIVFLKKFEIPDRDIICGKPYNHSHFFKAKKKAISLRHKWHFIDYVQNLLYNNDIIDERFEQDSVCLLGAPIYCPQKYAKDLQEYLITHVNNVESHFNSVCPYDTFQSIEEERPLMEFAKKTGGVGFLDDTMYRHGLIYAAHYNLEKGFDVAEDILGIKVFDTYFGDERTNS
jgi:hypothetical protein